MELNDRAKVVLGIVILCGAIWLLKTAFSNERKYNWEWEWDYNISKRQYEYETVLKHKDSSAWKSHHTLIVLAVVAGGIMYILKFKK